MSDLVEYSKHGTVGVITVVNPPVNALSFGVPQGIIDGIAAGEGDGEITALVLIGSGRTFIAGADIREFNKPRPAGAATIRDLIERLEGAAKPVVAAIHGSALGGGLEVAMGCHYRCAVASARLGQPEVKLGLLPGAGGTQRLPRLIGLEAALEMIVNGDPIDATRAHDLGLVDELIEGDLLDGAIAMAMRISDLRKARDDDSKLVGDAALFDAMRSHIARRARGRLAPAHCIAAVEAALRLPFDEGIVEERRLFEECLASAQAKALMHVFFAERAAVKVAGVTKQTPVLAVALGGVVGAGTMGGGIAMNFANAGIPVLLTDASQELLDAGIERIRANYQRSVKSGRIDAATLTRRMALIEPTLALEDFADVDFVIEAVFEEFEIKRRTFRALDGICKRGAILASNTSYLDINALAAETGRAEKVIGTHFFSPANVMRLLEIVRGEATNIETLATAVALAKAMGKVGVVVGVCHGFVGNRMLYPYGRENQLLLLEGAAPEYIDKVLFDWGMAMGPNAVGDLAGLDVGYKARHARTDLPDDPRFYQVADMLVEQARLGQNTGRGTYLYESGSRIPTPDPAVQTMINEEATRLGIDQRDIEAEEIIDRCIYSLIIEGARILEDGIAIRSSDIDVIWTNGYGFPRHRGGPMHYADSIGLDRVYDKVCEFQKRFGSQYWEAPKLLQTLAAKNGQFGA